MTALDELLAGAARWESGEAVGPHRDETRRTELISGQSPRALVLGCSDSRVVPEIVLDQGLGDLFTVRTAGGVPDAAVRGSIEYAIDALGVELVAVLGHTSCGAVTAAQQERAGESVSGAYLPTLVGGIVGRLAPVPVTPDEDLTGLVEQHTLAVADEVRSTVVAHSTRPATPVVALVHHLDTGATTVLER